MELESTKELSPSSQTTGCGEDFLAEVQTVALPEMGYVFVTELPAGFRGNSVLGCQRSSLINFSSLNWCQSTC